VFTGILFPALAIPLSDSPYSALPPDSAVSGLQVECLDSLQAIPAADWDALNRDGNPFLSHDFLGGLERYRCLEGHGWMPMHLVIRRNNRLVAALPLYLRDNSFGEFVFVICRNMCSHLQ